MPNYNIRKHTVYTGNLSRDRPGKNQAPIRSRDANRTDNKNRSDLNNPEIEESPLKQIRRRRDESLLKISTITKDCSVILFKAKTVFPFDLFPDEILITSTKIEVNKYSFFSTYNTITIPIQDIGYVEVEKALFFATLSLINVRQTHAMCTLNYLWTKDAIRCRNILNGLLIAQEAGVDVSILEPKKLLPQLEGLGV